MSIDDDLASLRAGYGQVDAATRPMMRWWWFGPDVDDAELDRELTAMAEGGLGGVEVAFVHPMRPTTTAFLSDEMLAHLRHAADTAARLGLRFDPTIGSGWSYGGPHIGPEVAARRVHWQRHDLAAGAHRLRLGPAWPGDEVIAAYVGVGSVQEPTADLAALPLERDGDDTIALVPDGVGTRHVLVAVSRLTGQQVKRAAFGAEGPVLDHYSADATRTHLRAVGDPSLDAVPAALIGSVFCDSLEVYDADWTPDLPAEFEARRGYPLTPHLPLLVVDTAVTRGDGRAGLSSAQFRSDYHRTLAELYRERFLEVMASWAHERGVLFRVQNYGTPAGLLSSHAAADLLEGEGWGWTELTATRWASSAAHHLGCEVVSAETWTWVHSPSLRATPLDLKAEAHEHLLNGVTHLIGHGWPYSPHGAGQSDTPGTGWLFYAAGCLDDRNPWWPVMRPLSSYLARQCWLLRQGERINDVTIVLPTDDLLAATNAGSASGTGDGRGHLDLWRAANAALGPDLIGAIRRSGLDYDLVDDDLIAAGADAAPVIVVPPASTLPPETIAWLERQAETHVVLLIDGGSSEVVPVAGAEVIGLDGLADALAEALPDDVALNAPTEIGRVRRRIGDLTVDWLANTTSTARSITLTMHSPWQRWSAGDDAGEVSTRRFAPTRPTSPRVFAPTRPTTSGVVAPTRPTSSGAGEVTLTLAPYEATVLVSGDFEVSDTWDDDAASEPLSSGLRLDSWTVDFGDGALPVSLPHRWEDDPARLTHSGTATYRTTVTVDDPGPALLDLGEGESTTTGPSPQRGMVGPSYRAALRGPVGEVARVVVNGIDCGTLWAPPHVVDVGHALVAGENAVEIEVTNTGANALSADATVLDDVRATEAVHGRRFVMQDLGRCLDDVSSGLLAVPVLRLAPSLAG